MKKSLVLAVVLAATVATACGGDDRIADTPPGSPPATVAGPAGTPGVEAALPVLDEQTTAWFATFCTGFAGVRDSLPSVLPGLTEAADTSPQERQAATAAVVADLGRKFEVLAADTAALPPPTFANGAQLATSAVAGFTGIGAAMVDAAHRFAAAPVTDTASLQDAATGLQTALQAEVAKAEETFSAIDTESAPGLDEAVGAIPECAALTP